MKVTKALKLIKKSHKAKAAQDLFNKRFPPLLIPPGFEFPNKEENEHFKSLYLKLEDEEILKGMGK